MHKHIIRLKCLRLKRGRGYICVSVGLLNAGWGGGASVPVIRNETVRGPYFASRCWPRCWELEGVAYEFKPMLGYIL